MSACLDYEIRPEFNLSPKERALARDSFVRDFERRFSDWSEIARVCCEVERDKDWQLLGFKSYHAWLMEAAPRSRSYIYLVTGRYRELKDDFTDDELAQIDLDSTTTLRKLSSAVRRDPKVREAAKKKPRELRQVVIETHPEQHIEDVVEKTFKFESSAWDIIEQAFEKWREEQENPNVGMATFFEWLVSEVML